jgi:hypothetical protein
MNGICDQLSMSNAILVNCPPEITLLALNLHEDFVDVEGITIASVLTLQSSRIFGAKFDTSEAD